MKYQVPYTEVHISGKMYLREFNISIPDKELIWHLDKEDRIISVVKGSKWKLQLDNELPVELSEGKEYFIPKLTYHRVIKGNNKLVIKLYKL